MRTCAGCGGALLFDIGSQTLKCRNCGNRYEVPESDRDADKPDPGLSKEMVCDSCGAVIDFDENTDILSVCPFCGSNLTSGGDAAQSVRYIIPFKVTEEAARRCACRTVPEGMTVDDIKQVYMPYRVYSESIVGEVTVQLSSKIFAGFDTEGNKLFEQVNRECGVKVDVCIDDVAMDASYDFNDLMGTQIEPFEGQGKKRYSPEYTYGIPVRRPDVESRELKDFADSIFNRELKYRISKKLRKEFSCQSVSRIEGKKTEEDLALFPVWRVYASGKGNRSVCAVNGQTEKISNWFDISLFKKSKKLFWCSIIKLSLPLLLLFSLLMLPLSVIVPLTEFCAFSLASAAVYVILFFVQLIRRRLPSESLLATILAALLSLHGIIVSAIALSVVQDGVLPDNKTPDSFMAVMMISAFIVYLFFCLSALSVSRVYRKKKQPVNGCLIVMIFLLVLIVVPVVFSMLNNNFGVYLYGRIWERYVFLLSPASLSVASYAVALPMLFISPMTKRFGIRENRFRTKYADCTSAIVPSTDFRTLTILDPECRRSKAETVEDGTHY